MPLSSPVAQSTATPLTKSLRSEIQQLIVDCLRSELQQLIVDRLEEMLRPLREETSTIKLWLACLANHLEFAESHEEHTSFPNMLELFGPCSPVHHLRTNIANPHFSYVGTYAFQLLGA